MSQLMRSMRVYWSLSLPERRRVLIAGDAVLAVCAALLALWLWAFTAPEPFSLAFVQARALWLIVLPAAWLLLNLGSYNYQRALGLAEAFREMLGAASLAVLLYWALFFVAPPNTLPRLVILYFILAATGLGLMWRLLYNRVFSSALFQRRLLVVGGGWAGREIIRALHEFQPEQYAVVGVIDDDPAKQRTHIGSTPVLGGHERLRPAIETLGISEIVLAIHDEIRGATFQALLDCRARGLPIVRMTSLYEQVTGRVPLDHLDPDWVIAAYMDQNRIRALYHAFKRGLDLLGSIIGLCGLAVLFPFIAAAIRLEGRGPIFYRQMRLGQAGKPFTIYKFRSMVPDAEREGARWATRDDARVTRVGTFLRRTRLDEAPQLWNVLRGEMSLIGPRPERPEFTNELEAQIPFYRARLIIKPGITGWAQVNYGYASTVADAALKLQWDLYYIKHRSVWLDLLILARTIGVVIRLKGT